jgi:succinate dehydrogenase/fumarate reductase cytochrome b subunit
MKLKRLHYLTGFVITTFIVVHLINHVFALWGADKHIAVMHMLRSIYRNRVMEICLLLAVSIQVASGLRLWISKRKILTSTFDKLQLWSGIYLAFFFIIHISAVLTGRFLLQLDTNFYFGVAGLNTFPLNLFFIPYYSLAIVSFFVHVAMVHAKRMKWNVLYLTPHHQAKVIMLFGVVLTIIILYGLTNGFKGFEIPEDYQLKIELNQ